VAVAVLAASVAVVAATGCGGGGGGTPTSPGAPTPPASPASPGGAPIFDPGVLHEARLDLDPSAWQALRDNYLDNQYYAANLTVDGVAVQQVGIRSRGESSRNEEKPGLNVDFNKYVPGQEYYGYKSLVIDNITTDASLLRERLSFLVFEAMGIAAPRNAFARLSVNGEYWGVVALVEPVSKPFLHARLGEESGALFDYEWVFPYDFSWLGPEPSAYVPLPFQPETNEDHPDVANGLVGFVEAVNYTRDADFVSTMGSWLDVDRFLTMVPGSLADPINALPQHERLVILVLGYLVAPLFLIVPLMVSAVLAGYGDKLKAKPEVYREFQRVLHASMEYARTHPDEVFPAVGKEFNIDPGFFQAWFSRFSDFPVVLSDQDVKAIALLWEKAKELDILKSYPPVQDAIWKDALTENALAK